MKVLKTTVRLVIGLLLLVSQPLFAVPTFQVYAKGATAGDFGADEDTWLTYTSPFTLVVAGAYRAAKGQGQKATESLLEVTLLLSVPKEETGAITITGGDIGATLLTTEPLLPGLSGFFNPKVDADIDLLTNESGNPAGYDGYTTKEFLPDDVSFNNHYPFKEDVSNFLIYGIGDFDEFPNAVSNYNTEEGIEPNIANGEEKEFMVSISGFSRVHFDVYGFEMYKNGRNNLQGMWKINPGSHDVTFIPAPSTILLTGVGGVIVGWLHRSKLL